MKKRFIILVLGIFFGQSLSAAVLNIEALDGTYWRNTVRVLEVADVYEISIDAFSLRRGFYTFNFLKEKCVVQDSTIKCLAWTPVFFQPVGPDPLKQLDSILSVFFSLDKNFVNLIISKLDGSDERVHFSIQQVIRK